MRYITWAELCARYKKVASDYDATAADLGFIQGAEAEVDARLANRYTVPFTPVPPMIKDLVIDMAYYRMYWMQEQESALKDFIERRLAALTAGSATLTMSGTSLVIGEVEAWSDRDGIRSVFGPDDPTNYSVSESWQDNAQSERDND